VAKWITLFDPKDEVPSLDQRVVVYGRANRPKRRMKITSHDDVFGLMESATYLDREGLWAMVLDEDDRLVGIFLGHLGGTSSTYIDAGTLMRILLICGSPKAIVMHNHPSGEGTPSVEDLLVTERMQEASALFGISVDHLILSRSDQCITVGKSGPRSGLRVARALASNPPDSIMPLPVAKYELRTSIVDAGCRPEFPKILGSQDAEKAVRMVDPSDVEAVALVLDIQNRVIATGNISVEGGGDEALLGMMTMALVSGATKLIVSWPSGRSRPPKSEWSDRCEVVGLSLLDLLYRPVSL